MFWGWIKGGGAISFKGVEDRSSRGRANKITLNIPVKASFRYCKNEFIICKIANLTVLYKQTFKI